MKIKLLCISLAVLFCSSANAQKKQAKVQPSVFPQTVARPKLVVGMVIDQMRWDYLYRFYARYGNGGFKRLINEGFSAENTLIPYTPTLTACGHSSIYTGSVPAINGIIGNNWFDPQLGRDVYCVEDKSVKTVGSSSNEGLMSPKNLLVTTVTDELRMATNFRSKVISVSIKDRGAILPGGHTANGAYWYDDMTGSFISSTHYMQQLPTWVNDFNAQRLPNKYFEQDWNTLYPIETYTESTADAKPYERTFKGAKTSSFPHLFKQYANKNYSMMASMPQGNSFTLEFAKAAIPAEKLGQTGNTDFLAVSLSSTDYVGHQFGPNSIELEDTYLRLDKDLEDFFNYLDKTIGKGNYLLFLTADHGATHVPGFLRNKMPGGRLLLKVQTDLDSLIFNEFKVRCNFTIINNQVIFDTDAIKEAKADYAKIKQSTIDYLVKQDGVLNAVDIKNMGAVTIPQEIKNKIINGYNARRSGDVYIILDAGWYPTLTPGTGHAAWNPYDSHIPALFMGWGVKPGKTNKEYYMSDIAPTVSALLHIQQPSGSIGKVITDLLK
uniref:Alkaline phosphatase PhoV n=1 Tax=Synechococcus elongatus (strain ATCC 33912 / PCC 7942 / FACHB-805) TaxID=1140 RepID=ALPH_SYNE7|nr:RecName: Full=Alkaline phosphatase PhoV; Short=APase PhoV; Flags: Precursor [Synechococcus elongatus PCC 7942 = FACHB-805]CAA88739.1 alkaline phosphatase [Synechococcus elongatus PCC 7942 = FACHB-805]